MVEKFDYKSAKKGNFREENEVTIRGLMLEWIDENSSRMLDWVIKWANCNSGSANISGLKAMQSLLIEAFSHLQGKLEAISLGELPALRLKKEGNPSFLLAGHFDTVFPEDSSFQTCAFSDEKTLIGPGVADMKGGLAILLMALEAFEKTPEASKVGWTVLLTPDEETGSLASLPLLQKEAKEHSLGLVFEPSLPDGSFVSARKGSFNIVASVKGTSAHAGRDFFKGKNAITALMEWALYAERLTSIERGITVNIGKVAGGEASNIVPKWASLELNVRMEEMEDHLSLWELLNKEAENVGKKRGLSLELFKKSFRPPKPFDKKHQELFSLLKQCGDALSIPIYLKKSGGVCDGNFLAQEGLPVIDTLGAIGGNLHTHQEYMEVESLKERAKLTFTLLKTWSKKTCR